MGTMDVVQFFRFLPSTSTHRYALTSNPFPAIAPFQLKVMSLKRSGANPQM